MVVLGILVKSFLAYEGIGLQFHARAKLESNIESLVKLYEES